jgi:hypothetical protein
MTAGGLVIEQLISGLYLNIAIPATFYFVSVTNDLPSMTGQNGYVTFNFQAKVALPVNTYFAIQYPSDFTGWMTATASSNCTIFLQNTTHIVVRLTSAVAINSVSNFKISNVIYPRSSKPCSFTITALNASDITLLIHLSSTTFAMANFNTITAAFSTGTMNYKLSTQPILLDVTVANAFVLGDILQINLPITAYQRNADVATIPSDGQFSYTTGITNTTIIATVISPVSNTVSLTISGFIILNPSPLGIIIVVHLDGNNYICDSQATLSFSLTCTSTCQTCDTVNTSKCLSCYSNTANNVFNSSTNTCVGMCSSTQ